MGKELRWYNDDEVSHKIIITGGEEQNNRTNLFDSGNIKPKASFSYKFDKAGTSAMISIVTHTLKTKDSTAGITSTNHIPEAMLQML
jgi:plastocyanin